MVRRVLVASVALMALTLAAAVAAVAAGVGDGGAGSAAPAPTLRRAAKLRVFHGVSPLLRSAPTGRASAVHRKPRPVPKPTLSYLRAKYAAEHSLTGRGKPLVALRFPQHRAASGKAAAAAPNLVLGRVFEGIGEGQGGGYSPPDPQLAVSPSFVVEMVNVAGAYWPRTGGAPHSLSIPTVFGAGANDNLSDPQLSFDAVSGRFIAGIMDITRGQVIIAVSSGPDPSSAWTTVPVDFGHNACPDQPKMGFDDQIVAFSVNLFTGGDCNSSDQTSAGSRLVVINKAQILDPNAAVVDTQTFDDQRYAKIAPARSLSSTGTDYMAAVDRDHSTVLHVLPFVGAPPSGGFQGRFDIKIRSLDSPPPAIQPGSEKLDTDDNRIRDAAWRNGLLFAGANDGCQFDKDTKEHSCARVMAVSTVSHATVIQDDLGFVGQDTYYPAIEPDVASSLDVVIGYSSPKLYPSVGLIGYTAHGYSDVHSIADGGAPLNDAEISPGIARLGDYFGAGIDPTQTNVVWGAGEYGKSKGTDNWGTVIGAMTLVPGAIPNPPPPRPSPAVKNAVYNGRTSQRKGIHLHTSKDGHFLIGIDYSISHRCAEGFIDPTSPSALSRQDTVPILKDGSFSFGILFPSDPFQRSGSATVTGRFQGTSASGTIKSTERSRHHGMCRSGTVRWTTHV